LVGGFYPVLARALLELPLTMPRKPFIRSELYPYHIINRSNNREWFYVPINDFWNILQSVLALEPVSSRLRIHALVLMSNHLHLLASSTDGNLGDAMEYLFREVCRKVNHIANRRNHVFGGPYKWSLVTNTSYYLLCLKYIYRNPIAANICAKVEDYPFSTIHAHRDSSHLPFPITPWRWAGDWLKWGDFQALLDWLNTPYPFGLSDYIRTASKHRIFTIPKNRNTRKIPSHIWDSLEPAYRISPYNFEEIFSPPPKGRPYLLGEPLGSGITNHPSE